MTTFIFGHKNPDTDTVCSSIALSYLKNELGGKTMPKVLGNINNETKFKPIKILSNDTSKTLDWLISLKLISNKFVNIKMIK